LALTSGTRLGVYEVIASIGVGGMGEVFRARDTKLNRDVALKVLPDSLAGDTERLARFTREAQTLAALNHPNIAHIHGFEDSGGVRAIVMELVDGDDLSQRIRLGAIPLDEALPIARQITDALEAAHEQGIIHRDLKPANIKLRPDGRVKVLDFGLAKGLAIGDRGSGIGDQGSGDVANSPTITSPAMTMRGVILGTAAYMAPEQAKGRLVDRRADIWAFGVVLYEMLTGRRAFEGEDVSTIMAAVIQTEPRWDGVPASARRLLESCLTKDPKKRLRDIGDVWKLLDDQPPVPSRTQTKGVLGWAAAGLLALVAAVALWAPWREAAALVAQPVLRLEATLGNDVSLAPLNIPTVSSVLISPDGTRLVYIGTLAGGPPKLLTRRLDQTNATELAGTEGAINPFFSRDGKWVAFWTGTGFYKVPVDGGSAVLLGELPVMTGGYWDDDGSILTGTGGPMKSGVLRWPSTGGVGTPLLELAKGEMFNTNVQILPGGKAILLQVVGTQLVSQDNYTVDVVSIADGARKTLARGVGSPRYLPSGHLVYTRKATMFAVPFDLERMEVRGTAVAILDDVAHDPISNGAQYDVSDTGTLVYRRDVGSSATVQWLDATGALEPLLARPAAYLGTPRLSPDGKRVALTIEDGSNRDIFVYEPGRGTTTRLTSGGAVFSHPVWTRDGRYVVYGRVGSGLYWSRADGVGQSQALQAGAIQLPTAISHDGTRLAYMQPDGNPQLWSVPIESGSGGPKAGKPERFMTTKHNDGDGSFSPDGRWLAYMSNESGRFEVYVRAFAASGAAGDERLLISNNGGGSPAWSPNGRELLYQAAGQIMTVGYTVRGGSFVAEKPRVWAAAPHGFYGFDLAPDGKRVATFVTLEAKASQPENTVAIVLNFFDELRRRAPIGQ
jgi:serine/threonine-protein kinase